ncbi:MAG: hypothetical protein HGA96_08975 [Desulfobulbaceae bacterium]|nr:hypothetical protein [Desulfobulbaceae bacterium]
MQNLSYAELDLDGAAGGQPPSREGFQVVSLGRPASSDVFRKVSLAQSAALPGQAPNARAEPSRAQQSPELTAVAAGGAGFNPQERQVNELLATLSENFSELSRLRKEVLTNSSDDMLRLVLAIAEQVIHCEVLSNPCIILATIEAALQAAIHADSYHVKVHPDDLALVREKKAQFMASISGLKNITIEGDATVSRGGCLVESELGQVDASIEGQLEELREKLLVDKEQ